MNEEKPAEAEGQPHDTNEELVLSRFEECLNDTFQVHLDADNCLELQLVEVLPLKHYPGAPRQEPFSLLFRGPVGLYFPQRLFDIEHPTLGKLQLFLVPMRPDEAGTYFESVVN